MNEAKYLKELSEISRGGGGVGTLSRGSEMRWPISAMGVKFANPPLVLGLKYHDPLHVTKLKEKCSRLFKVQYSKATSKQNKRKAKKASATSGS